MMIEWRSLINANIDALMEAPMVEQDYVKIP
jgi:hypothetical protein